MAKDNKKKLSAEDLEQASGGKLIGFTTDGKGVYSVDDPTYGQYGVQFRSQDANFDPYGNDPVYGNDPEYGNFNPY